MLLCLITSLERSFETIAFRTDAAFCGTRRPIDVELGFEQTNLLGILDDAEIAN